jgi:hypothetical protein
MHANRWITKSVASLPASEFLAVQRVANQYVEVNNITWLYFTRDGMERWY